MAKRKSLNRVSRRYSKRRSVDSIGSGHLDPDTSIVDEEQTLWWNNLEENTFPPHSMIHSENETPRMLRSNSKIDTSQSSDPTGWWKNLNSDSEPIASKSSRRSAAIVESRMLQISTSETSESEKELNLRKRKVRLKASNRKSINNAFANALNDPEATMPLKTRMKQVRSEVHIDSDSESFQGRSQENEEDSNSSPTSKILKLKPSIRTRRGGDGMKDQNAFQDVLTEDNVLNASTAKTSVAFEKESSQRSMHRNINMSKDHIDQRKSIRSPQTMPSILRTRKSGGMKDQTAFQDVPLEDDVLNDSTAEKSVAFEKESSQRSMHQNINTSKDHIDDQRKSIRALEDIETGSLTPNVKKAVPENNVEIESSDESIIIPRQHLKFMSRFMQRARKSIGKNVFADVLVYDSNASSSTSIPNKENNIHRSSIRKSPRLSLNKSKKQQSDVSVQDKDNIESNLSSLSFDNDESRGTKKSIFFKPKSRILTRFRKRSTNPFEEILEQGNISDRRSNVSFEDNCASSERETTRRINQERESLATQKNPQSGKCSTTNEEDSYEIFLEVSSNAEKNRSKEANILSEDENKLLENSDLNNASKSVSRKSVIAKSSEEKISNLKFIREKTLKEIACANAISPIGRLSTNVVIQDASDDSHADIDVEHVHSSESSSDKEARLTRNNLRIRSETPVNIEVREANDNLHNDANREHDSSMLKRSSKLTPSKETRLTRNSLRIRSETPVNIEVREANDNLHNDANREHDSSMLKRSSKLTPSKETRLTRNSLRIRSETPVNIEVREANDNLHNDANREHDSSMLKRSSKLTPSKETRLTRNSLRIRSETPVNIEVREANDNLHNDANREHDSSMLKRSSKLTPSKETRLTRNSLRIRSETPVNIEVREANDNLHNDANREHDSSMLKRSSKLTPSKETRLTRNSLRIRSETHVNIEVREANDNLHNDANREHDSSMLKRSSKLTPSKETRLTRNSLRIRSETPVNIEVREANDNLHNDANREHDSSTLKRSSKLTPNKEARLTRNSLRNRSETSKPANIEIHEDINNSRNDANSEHDSNMFEQLSKSTPSKEGRLMRNSSRNQSETLKPMSKNTEVSKLSMNLISNDDKDNNINVDSETSTDSTVYLITRADIHSEDNTNTGTQKSTSLSIEKEITDDEDAEPATQTIHRNSPSTKSGTSSKVVNRSKISKSMSKNMETSKRSTNLIADIEEDNNVNADSKTSDSISHTIMRADIRSKDNTNMGTQKSTSLSIEKEITDDEDAEPATQTIHRNSPMTKSGTSSKVVNRSKILKSTSKNMETSKRSTNLIADIEEDNNVNVDSEISDSISHTITRADTHSKDNTNIGTQKSTNLSIEKEITDDEDAEPATQTIQRNSLTKPGTSKTINRQSVQNSNRTSIEDREIAHRQKSLGKSQNYRNTPTKSSSKDISSNKQSSSKTLNKIDDFFVKIKETSAKQLSECAQKSPVFDSEKMKKIKMELEKLKSREMAAMKRNSTDKKASAVKKETVKCFIPEQDTKKKKPLMNSTKVVDKAFLVNGKVYRPPRLPRPKHWATDRLYKFLWKRLEPKYKLATRVKSEKFVQELATVVTTIERRKNYENYKTELKALMKEMTRLKIINTRMDFYHFCQDFLPYEFRIKVIPMTLPGNKSNIPFDPENVHTPLLDTE
ncbi:PREDICTED: uncharacterized protein MAL13P1.304-like [Trachymyrmex cornetzi]|uniref:uncharacterized protein MAL13P1.304-like n=1 Tax=Trachymyrmex cornetzi TaxID=471704 RepID=UPI00084EEB65|nr:PREDICTED: uncharacterized protein MAL13P1.304-like [Trachymyrmex cornetzi]